MTKAKTRKKPVAKRKSAPKKIPMRSFRLSKQEVPFMTMRLTIQTLYWVVIGGIIIFLTLWIVKLQSEIQAVYDTIEMSASVDGLADYSKTKLKKQNQ